jgi:cell division transport system permease protein
MVKNEKKSSKGRVKTSYVSTIISISLVLFMLGMLGLILLNAQRVSNYVKENIGLSLYLKEDVKQSQINELQSFLESKEYVKRTVFVSSEEAAELMKKDLGEDFVDFLGFNPLTASIDVFLNADFAESENISKIEKELSKSPLVKEVVIQKDLLSEVNRNIRKIGVVLLGFSLLLLIIVIALINNTIRLAIYSKRFLIKTMQLVGATEGFIKRPFILRSILNGFLSGVISLLLLLGVIYSVQNNIPEFIELQNFNDYIILFLSVIVLGIVISWFSTSMAVSKFLKMQSGDLY